MPLIGAFIAVGGTYGVIQQIIDAYADGLIGKFSTIHKTAPVSSAFTDVS